MAGYNQTTEADRNALQRCLDAAMRDPLRAEQLNSKLDDGEHWFDVADFACYCVQGDALQLDPWQEPPSVEDETDPNPDDKDAQALLKQMLAAGLSRYEPDPLAALAKKKTKTKTKTTKKNVKPKR